MSNNDKYNKANYSTAISRIVNGTDYNKVDTKLYSSLLLVTWKLLGNFKRSEQSNLLGTLKVTRLTPLGELEPLFYPLKINEYIQFLDIPLTGYGYTVEILNPNNVIKSTITIREYLPNMDIFNPPADISGLVAATTANATAITNLAASIGLQPEAIADAIANNNTKVYNSVVAVGTALVQALLPDTTRQNATITNWEQTTVKVWLSSIVLANTTVFSSDGATATLAPAKLVNGVMQQGGVLSLDIDQAKGGIYLISSAANGKVTLVETKNV